MTEHPGDRRLRQIEQVAIASDDRVGIGRDGKRDEGVVARIAAHCLMAQRAIGDLRRL